MADSLASSQSAKTDEHIKLILASSSPYRRRVLARLGIEFACIAPDIDEQAHAGESPVDLVQRLAVAKAQAVVVDHPDTVVIGGDQVLACNSEIFGKPGTAERAREQLAKLAGQTGIFHTGLAVIYKGRQEIIHATTEVTWRALTEDEIAAYVEREPALDCAGSAKLEGLGASLIESMTGSEPTAILGIPLVATSRILRTFGILPN